jgi:hypothetical protein
MPTEWWFRPVSRQARVGEHKAVVWKLAKRSPPAAKRSKVGVSRSDPKHPSWAKPTSSSTTKTMLGAPGAARSGSGHHGVASWW